MRKVQVHAPLSASRTSQAAERHKEEDVRLKDVYVIHARLYVPNDGRHPCRWRESSLV